MRTALITGGTDGLGRALADCYERQDWRVIVTGRTFRGAGHRPFIPADLAHPDAHESICAGLVELDVMQLDLLILNAAMGVVAPVEAHTPAAIERLLQVNLIAPMALTHALLPGLRAARGRVVFIGSTSAFMPAAGYALYAASKRALDGFARSLAQELRGSVAVQVVHPGPIGTEFHARAGANGLDASRFPSAERVALQVAGAIEGAGWRRFVDARGRLLASAARALHRPLDAMLMRRAGERSRAAPGTGSLAVVTGAASGLGAALVAALLARGHRVIGVDRDALPVDRPEASVQSTRRIGPDRHEHWQADLADPLCCTDLAARLAARGVLGYLIHCAGTSAVGAFRDQPFASASLVVRTNFMAPVLLTSVLMQSGGIGRGSCVVLISSLSHYTGYPGAAAYAASKDGLAQFGRSLRIALAVRGASCLTVFPGPMRTPHARRFAPKGASEGKRMAPERVAAAVLSAAQTGRPRLVVGHGAHLAMIGGSIAPTAMTRVMRGLLYERLVAEPGAPLDQRNAPSK